jgi:hypothetical protein
MGALTVIDCRVVGFAVAVITRAIESIIRKDEFSKSPQVTSEQ